MLGEPRRRRCCSVQRTPTTRLAVRDKKKQMDHMRVSPLQMVLASMVLRLRASGPIRLLMDATPTSGSWLLLILQPGASSSCCRCDLLAVSFELLTLVAHAPLSACARVYI